MIFGIIALLGTMSIYCMSVCVLELLMGVEGCYQAYKDRLESEGICISNSFVIIISIPLYLFIFMIKE